MPIIAAFFGIVIRMFYKEHEPAHFHAEHQGQQAKVDFDGNVVAGQIQSNTALRLIREWALRIGRSWKPTGRVWRQADRSTRFRRWSEEDR